jgi:hypothetical protein
MPMSTTQQRLDAYLAAEAQILGGQAYRMGERQLTLADLAEVRRAISDLKAELARESATQQRRSSLGYSLASFGRGAGEW